MSTPLVQPWLEARREIFEGAFLYCTDCEDVHRASSLDQAPIYGVDGTPRSVDDLHQFLGRHADHRLRVLRRSSDAEIHSHPRHDPMRRVCWEVSDGEGRFVVSFGREDLESPRSYTIVPGRLVLQSESIEIDGDLLREIFDDALYPHAAPPSHLERLIEKCRERIAILSWDTFELIDEDREDPSVQLACFPECIVGDLGREARTIFPGPEGKTIADVVAYDLRLEIPVVRLSRRYVITPR